MDDIWIAGLDKYPFLNMVLLEPGYRDVICNERLI